MKPICWFIIGHQLKPKKPSLKEIAGLTAMRGNFVATVTTNRYRMQIGATENNEQPDISKININKIKMNNSSHLLLLRVLQFGLQGWNNYL